MIRGTVTSDAGDVPAEVRARPYVRVPRRGVPATELLAKAETAPLDRVSRRSTRCDTMPLPVMAEPPAPIGAPPVCAPPPAVRREHTVLKLSFAGFGLTLAVALAGVALSGRTPSTPGVPQAAAPVVSSPSLPPTTTTVPAPTTNVVTTQPPAQVATHDRAKAQQTHQPKAHHASPKKASPADPRAKLQELLRTIQNYQHNPPRIPGWPPTR